MNPKVSLDFQFTNAIEKVWSALTNSELLAKWVWKNDFKPVIGHKFQFRAEPTEWWDGIVKGEVLVVEQPHKIAYTWNSGKNLNVVWELQTKNNGTALHFELTGFETEDEAFQGAKYGWENLCNQLEKLLSEM